jgi:hypothetical protein
MSKKDAPTSPPPPSRASAVFEAIKLDFNTIKIIVLTAAVVTVLIATPLVLVLSKFVTFDALDDRFKVTDSVRPKILQTIAEGLDTGYSKNFIISSSSTDNTMLFYASQGQKVTLSISAESIGPFPQVSVYLNNCPIEREPRSERFNWYEKDMTSLLKSYMCGPDEPNLHTLRIVVSGGVQSGTELQMKCLVLVYQRIHDPPKEQLPK